MWQFSLITNAILLSGKKNISPEEKERRQRQFDYEAKDLLILRQHHPGTGKRQVS